MTFELFFLVLTAAAIAVTSFVLFASLARGQPDEAEALLGAGDFEAVLALSDGSGLAPRQLLSRAVAAKHLARFDLARDSLLPLAQEGDGEAQLELGLVAGYQGRFDEAREQLRAAARTRADLSESLQLHRAWIELASGRVDEARRLFHEIEAPLENKLRQDLGAGEPMFLEWFLHAALLWRAAGETDKAAWALNAAREAAPQSRLPALLLRNADTPKDPASG